MELYKPSVTMFLDTRKTKENGKFPLKLTVYLNPNKKRYGTGIDLTEEEWKKLQGARLKDENLKELKIKVNALQVKAEKIINKISPFSFNEFERLYFSNASGKINTSLQECFNEYISELEKSEREGTRSSYNTTLNSLLSFRPNVLMTDVTRQYLEEYEMHMFSLGKSPSTVGIYLRQLRCIINKAIERGLLKRENYPFRNYKIPASRNIKKALSDQDLKLLLSYHPKTKWLEKGYDFWVFSYLCNGINMADVVHLIRENVNCEFLYFIRQKTKRTKKQNLRPIKVHLHERAKLIIDKWKNNDPHSPYLFPVLEPYLSAKTVKNRTQRFIKNINSAMENIRKDLDIEQKLGTYVARHTFSTRLMRKGASTHFIKECLGHSSVISTENYLGDFEENIKKQYTAILTAFD